MPQYTRYETKPLGICDFLATCTCPVLLVVWAHTTFHTYLYLSQGSSQPPKTKYNTWDMYTSYPHSLSSG